MINITAVSYLNTLPFIYGIINSGFLSTDEYILHRKIPSVCTEDFIHKTSDIVLVPSGTFNSLPENNVISSFCIGAVKQVKSVLLVSQQPVENLTTVLLDYQSTTSVKLIKILANFYWKKKFQFVQGNENYEKLIRGNTGGLIIGDRALTLSVNYLYVYDLAAAWWELTKLPFVFAFWAKTKELPADFIQRFNLALQWGVEHLFDSISLINQHPTKEQIYYLSHCISFLLNEEKKSGLAKFYELASSL